MSDFSFTSTSYGYMLYYKGEPLGGADTFPALRGSPHRHWRHVRADAIQNFETAQRLVADLERTNEHAYRERIAQIEQGRHETSQMMKELLGCP